jgi:hypothetical protein
MMRVISVPAEGDHKGPHPASTSTPAHTMTTDGLMRCFVIIVWAGAVEVQGGDPCGCPDTYPQI